MRRTGEVVMSGRAVVRVAVVVLLLVAVAGIGTSFNTDLEAGYWMNETSSPTIDKSGNGYDAVWDGNPASTTLNTDIGDEKALDFDGTGDHLDPGSQFLPNNWSSAYTVCGWVNHDSGSPQKLVSQTDVGDNFDGIQIGINSNGDWQVFMKDEAGNVMRKEVTWKYSGQTTHVCTSYNGTPISQGVKIYFNSTENTSIQNTGDASSATGRFDTDNTASVIGARDADSADQDQYWDGIIDELNVYHRALSSSEIQNVMDCSQTSCNQAPVFNSTNINPEPPLIGQFANYSAEVYDSDGSIQHTNLSLSGSAGCSLSDEKRTGTNPSWDGLCTPSSTGWLNATFDTLDDAGAVTTSELIRSVESNPPNISIERPDDEEKALDVPINYTVSDDFLVTGCSYNIDGGTNTSLPDCTNTSTSFSQVGNYTLNLYANDSGGNTGHKSKYFIANLYNWFSAEDDVAGSSINDFSVTFSNGTTSGGSGSTTTGEYRTGTIELPTGNVTARFSADGYSKTTMYYQVDDSFQLNDTIQMERTSLSFEVFDEQNTESNLHYNTTVSNSTKSIDVTSIVKRSETNGGYETYLDQDWVVADEVDFLATELDGDSFDEENCYRITLTYLNQSTKEISECQGRNDVSDTVSISDLLYRNIKFELYNAGQDGDSFDVDVTVEDTDKNGFTAEYLDLTDAGFPNGDLRWRVNNKIYNARTYFTDFDPFTTISLTAYLLQEGQGNYINVETVDSSFNTVSNADITIQQTIDGTYQTVAQGRTGTTGTASFYLNPDLQHRIIVTHPNYASFTGTFEPSNYQFDPLQIQLGSTSAGGYTTVWDTVEAQVLPATATLTPEQHSWNASIIDSENSLSSFSFTIHGPNQTLNSSTVTNQPSGGFINLTANLSQFDAGTDITATLQFSKEQQVFNYTRTYTVRDEVEAGPFSIIKTMQTFENEASDFATSMTAVIILLAVGTFTGSAIGGTGAGIIMLVFLGFFVVTNWIDMFTFIITAFTLLGLYAMNRG